MPKGKPFPENEIVWIDCTNEGCEYHVRVHQSTVEANLRQHKEKGCPLVTNGETPEVKDRSPLELQAPLCPEPCSDCECLPSNWYDQFPLAPATSPEPISREDSPKVGPTPSHSWEPLRKALSDEEKYAKWLGKQNLPVEEFASGLKRDTTDGKINWSLVYDGPLLRRWAILMTEGAKVKGKRNWLNAGSVPETAEDDLERFREGAARHFAQWMNGETDEDHAAAVVFNLNGYEHVKKRMASSD